MFVPSLDIPDLRLHLPSPKVEPGLAMATLLADRNRIGILTILQSGPHCVCEMAAALGERSNNVSNHLARLREAGLVCTSPGSTDTRRTYYERNEQACQAALQKLASLLSPLKGTEE
jgi:DNA-binding transcriptional ArsR family regulator